MGGELSDGLHSIPPFWRFSKNISQVTILRHEILAKGTYFTVKPRDAQIIEHDFGNTGIT